MYLYGFPLRSIMSRLFRLSTSVPFFHVSSGWLSMIFKTSSLYGMCDVSTTARNSSHATPLSTQTISESGMPDICIKAVFTVSLRFWLSLLLLMTSPSMEADEVISTFLMEISVEFFSSSKKLLRFCFDMRLLSSDVSIELFPIS